MIKAEVNNCNNIISATIQLQENHLNIRYAMNGTGKSTIAKAIELFSNNKVLSDLTTFGTDVEPTCKLPKSVNKVIVFNEDFVNNVVFQEDEVIQNSFEIFIKTPEYEEQLKSINDRLKNFKVDLTQNGDLEKITSTGKFVISKFALTQDGELYKRGLFKSLLGSESIHILPEKLKKFQPFMNKEYNIEWVDWKNKGSKYDDNGICPFCTSSFNNEYESEKKMFTSSYTKLDVSNRIELLSYLNTVQDFMDENKKEKLYQCVQGTKNEQEIKLWIKHFYNDLKFLTESLINIEEFNSFQGRRDNISQLDDKLNGLIIDESNLIIFNNQKAINLINFVNQNIRAVLNQTDLLKSEIGQLNGLIGSKRKNAVNDINDFLSKADINYKFDIVDTGENTAKATLKYISKTTAQTAEVRNISQHLSWGERNAFALVLFMHSALYQNPDLIILDDPISSFDSNKKYAIINRLFSSDNNSFYKNTVLMLTHDMQPIIDFVITNKPTGEYVSACFLQNKAGIISELPISKKDIKSLPILLAENSKNEILNKVHRVASLRKLIEYMLDDAEHDFAYNLLSCLLHGEPKPVFVDHRELSNEEIKLGEKYVKQYIDDFEYFSYLKNIFTRDYLLRSFNEENNSYFRLQIFRVLIDVLNLRSQKSFDDSLFKYINEQLHVENDYIYTFDFMKYDIVPDFVIPKCSDYLKMVKC